MKNHTFVRTDLAAESPVLEENKKVEGISLDIEKKNSCETVTIKVLDKKGEKALGKAIGTYVTVSFGKVWNLPEADLDEIRNEISNRLKAMAYSLVNDKTELNVLVAGLGNRYITSDAIGPLAIKEITVTRHIKSKNPELFNMLEQQTVSAVAPGVTGQTGIETAELIKGAAKSVSPDLLVVIDALAAKSVDRLATTVQICDTGISPGSGISNSRQALNRETLGVPVIAIGVPTMVNSSTLVYDALEKAGITDISQELTEVLERGISFFVTLNETDTVVNTLSALIADSINLAFERK